MKTITDFNLKTAYVSLVTISENSVILCIDNDYFCPYKECWFNLTEYIHLIAETNEKINCRIEVINDVVIFYNRSNDVQFWYSPDDNGNFQFHNLNNFFNGQN